MLTREIWLLFFGYAVPMVISPGPGNTILATSGGRFGVRGTVAFWSGFEFANVALCLIYGLCLETALHRHPYEYQALKWIGTVYLLYLAWTFLRPSSKPSHGDDPAPEQLGFAKGFLAVALNPKIHSMIFVMFAQFLDPAKPVAAQVLQLTIAFLVVCVACHFPWIYAGKVLLGRFRSEFAMRVQGWVFGGCMLAVAAYAALA